MRGNAYGSYLHWHYAPISIPLPQILLWWSFAQVQNTLTEKGNSTPLKRKKSKATQHDASFSFFLHFSSFPFQFKSQEATITCMVPPFACSSSVCSFTGKEQINGSADKLHSHPVFPTFTGRNKIKKSLHKIPQLYCFMVICSPRMRWIGILCSLSICVPFSFSPSHNMSNDVRNGSMVP